jgi:hypothetical protein
MNPQPSDLVLGGAGKPAKKRLRISHWGKSPRRKNHFYMNGNTLCGYRYEFIICDVEDSDLGNCTVCRKEKKRIENEYLWNPDVWQEENGRLLAGRP